jgi:carboxyl-terminal processing protease
VAASLSRWSCAAAACRARISLSLTRSRIPNASVDAAYLIDVETGYIKVSRFASNTYDEFKAALADLRRQGTVAAWCSTCAATPAATSTAPPSLADEFIAGSRKIVYTDGKGDQYDSADLSPAWPASLRKGPWWCWWTKAAPRPRRWWPGPCRTTTAPCIVGRRTFGKGLVQQPIAAERRGRAAADHCPLLHALGPLHPETLRRQPRRVPPGAEHARAARRAELRPTATRWPKGLRFRTDHGRPVYGGGGIMPDVFVPRDSLVHSAYFTRLQSHGVLRAFALTFYQQHQAELEGPALRAVQRHLPHQRRAAGQSWPSWPPAPA